MERKTNVSAEAGKQELIVTREFDLPLELLFKAYTDPALLEQWMGTKVIRHENKNNGIWAFETRDGQGNIAFKAHGVIHEFVTQNKITRTFEMDNAPFGIQIEFLEFEKITEHTSSIRIQSVFKTTALRDELLKMPFAMGINMAHNRLQETAGKMK
jgi:uncharacterized protein YndB with AHSA1/START domain